MDKEPAADRSRGYYVVVLYNWHRPHGSLNAKPPIGRLSINKDNLLRQHTWSVFLTD